MGLFNSQQKKMERFVNELKKNGSPDAYKTRKSCYNCAYYSSVGNCNLKNRRTNKADYCSDYWGK